MKTNDFAGAMKTNPIKPNLNDLLCIHTELDNFKRNPAADGFLLFSHMRVTSVINARKDSYILQDYLSLSLNASAPVGQAATHWAATCLRPSAIE